MVLVPASLGKRRVAVWSVFGRVVELPSGCARMKYFQNSHVGPQCFQRRPFQHRQSQLRFMRNTCFQTDWCQNVGLDITKKEQTHTHTTQVTFGTEEVNPTCEAVGKNPGTCRPCAWRACRACRRAVRGCSNYAVPTLRAPPPISCGSRKLWHRLDSPQQGHDDLHRVRDLLVLFLFVAGGVVVRLG